MPQKASAPYDTLLPITIFLSWSISRHKGDLSFIVSVILHPMLCLLRLLCFWVLQINNICDDDRQEAG